MENENILLLKESSKRRYYVVTNPKWNNRLRSMDNHQPFADYIESTLGEAFVSITTGKSSDRFFYFQTLYIPGTHLGHMGVL